MKINFKQCNSDNYSSGRSQQIQFIVIHYTSNRGDTAKNNVDYFAREDVGASAHYFVDENEVWQSVKDSDVAWHCGAKTYYHDKCRNANSLGVEICMNDKIGKVREGSINNAAELVRFLMKKYNVSIDNVLRHYDVTHKSCPEPMVINTQLWENFKSQLIKNDSEEEEMKVYKHTTEMPDWARDTFVRLIKAGIVAVDKNGEISVQESSLQPMVYMDRLTGGKLEQFPELIK